MKLDEKRLRLIEEYGVLPDAQERFGHLLEASADQPSLPPGERRPEFLVEGCMASVWILADAVEGGRIVFRSDSDAPMVKAIAWLLTDFYSGASRDEILSVDPTFLRELRLLDALTENRRRGTRQIIARIKALARDP